MYTLITPKSGDLLFNNAFPLWFGEKYPYIWHFWLSHTTASVRLCHWLKQALTRKNKHKQQTWLILWISCNDKHLYLLIAVCLLMKYGPNLYNFPIFQICSFKLQRTSFICALVTTALTINTSCLRAKNGQIHTGHASGPAGNINVLGCTVIMYSENVHAHFLPRASC